MFKLPRIRRPRLKDCSPVPFVCSVKGRIIAGFGLILFILLAVVGGSTWQLAAHHGEMDKEGTHAATANLLQDLRVDVNAADAALQRYFVVGDEALPELRSNLAAAAERLAAALASEEMHSDEEGVAAVGEIAAQAAPLSESIERVIALRQSGDVQGAAAAMEAMTPVGQQLQLRIDEAAEAEFEKVSALRSRADRTGDLAVGLLITSGAIGAALGLAAAAFITRSILKPLSSLESTALAVAEGDLGARAPTEGPRELARVGVSLNRMTEALLDASTRRELEDERRKLSLAVEQSPASVIITDPDGRIEYVNPKFTKVTGYTLEEVIGKNPRILKSGETPPEVYKRLWETITSGGEWKGELHNKKKSGELYWESASISSVRDPDGAITHLLAVKEDITERKRAEVALRESETLYRDLVETSQDIVFRCDAEGRFTFLNPAWENTHGYPIGEMIGRPFTQFMTPEVARRDMEEFKRLIAGGSVTGFETTHISKSGREIHLVFNARSLRDAAGRIVGAQGTAHDITERKRTEEELHRLNQQLEALNASLETKVRERTQELQERNHQLLDARAQAATDGLTGLANHRAFHEKVNDELELARIHGNRLGLIILDIDGFKRVNDSLGHQEGDNVLREIAVTLSDTAGEENAYRYGGDEFAVLLPGADLTQTAEVAERIRRAVAKRTNDSRAGVTVSLGITSFPDVAQSAEELVYGADAAMYWAKSAGKDRVGDWGGLIKERAGGKLPWYAADRAVKAPDTVAALVAALMAKDPLTAGHTERCSWYAARLAQELGLTQEETSVVRLASLLHDVGKLAVPDEVLCKPGPLDEAEWREMKRHPVAALTILSHIRSITDAVPAILHHHEHFDGSGYPDGLAGDDIPIASRILLVTDAFDAMTTDRPYRKAMPVEKAIAELKGNSGSQFDPDVVDAFLRILSGEGAKPLTQMASV